MPPQKDPPPFKGLQQNLAPNNRKFTVSGINYKDSDIQINRKTRNLTGRKSIETDLKRVGIIEFVDKQVKTAIQIFACVQTYRLKNKNDKKGMKDLTKGAHKIFKIEKYLK